jgi:hypothetical protein
MKNNILFSIRLDLRSVQHLLLKKMKVLNKSGFPQEILWTYVSLHRACRQIMCSVSPQYPRSLFVKKRAQPGVLLSSDIKTLATQSTLFFVSVRGSQRRLRSVLLFMLILSSFFIQPAAQAQTKPFSVLFSQKIMAFDSQGLPYSVQKIDPSTLPGIREQVYSMNSGRSLAIRTNLGSDRSGDLEKVAAIVKSCYRHVENSTGMGLSKGVLLYLIELDKIPFSYEFEAKYAANSNWGEVRLVLLQKGRPLWGNQGSGELSEFLFDTLPHELGHDILGEIKSLQHDIDGQPSFHTRWFIEGVCELLAKSFSRREVPQTWEKFMGLRNIGSTFENPHVRRNIFNWAQENQYAMGLESDLYGASWLIAMSWTEKVPLYKVLRKLDRSSRRFDGSRLLALLSQETGLDAVALLNTAVRKELTYFRKGKATEQTPLQAHIPQKADIAL